MEVSTMSEAMQLHAQILKNGQANQPDAQKNLSKLFTFSALSPSGDRTYARLILKTLRTPNSYYYNTMIRSYSDSPDPARSLHLFFTMLDPKDNNIPPPDNFTYPFVLKACSKLKNARLGKQVHGLVLKSGMGTDKYINNALIHLYADCSEPGLAFMVFDKMLDKDVVSWTSIIDGFVDNDRAVIAIDLFKQMMENCIDPNEATFVSVLRACADTGALSVGVKIHELVKEKNLDAKANVSTALIDMYAKCGCIDDAHEVFNRTLNINDVFAWTAMISGLASHGKCKEAVELFKQITKFGVEPDERTITAVLSACRNAGWVDEGMDCFRSMRKNYKIKPTIQHYGCVVDMLARAGRLEDAEEFLKKMPIEPDAVLWRTLIWACRNHGDVERGERFRRHLEMDSTDSGSYVLLGNLYASAGKWQEKAKLRELMSQRGLAKPPGQSRIEFNEVVHEFTAGDSGHAEAERIYVKLDELEDKLRDEGYAPKIEDVLLDIDDEEKESQLLHHSEKLAVSFGLITTHPMSVIRVVKNLRSCEDCHTFMKLISKVYHREIVIRDRVRFHYFKNGECSCGDYW